MTRGKLKCHLFVSALEKRERDAIIRYTRGSLIIAYELAHAGARGVACMDARLASL